MAYSRFHSIDLFRGLAILGMVLANFIAGVNWIPSWLKHAPDIGFTIVDLVAPMFIFAIALNYHQSFQRRLDREGAGKTYQHFLTRFLALLGLGALFSAGEVLMGVDGQTINWGVLQAIGVAGLVTLCLIRAPAWLRALVGILILVGYQLMLDHFWLATILASPHGGLLGSISWSAMMLLATALSDLFFAGSKGQRNLIGVSALLVLAALTLTLWAPISKNRVSMPYVLLSLGLSGLIFCACHILVEQFKYRSRLVVLWGRNPLIMYVLHLLLIGFVYLPDIPVLYAQASFWLVLVEGAALLGFLTWIGWWLDKKKVYLSL